LAEVTRQVAALNEEASNANEDFLEAQINVDNANRRLSSVQSRITREQRNLNRVRNDISSLASIAYRSGGLDSSLELLLADNPTEFLNRSASLDQLSRGQGASLRRAQASSQRLAQDQLASAASAADAVSSRAAKARALLARLTAEDRARYAAAQAARRASIERASRAAIRSGGSSGGGFSGGSAGSGRAATAVAYVKAQVGDNYVWGADGPSSFDCSGLMLAAWGTAGVSLPHQSRSQYAATSRVSRSELRPGDLVFFYSPISHVGMYIGGGLMVHAANPGDGVVVDSINGYWSGRWAGAGRV
jgi:cell wall-associated NlpC family hydrolase